MSERQIAHEDLIKLVAACGGNPYLLESALNKPKNLKELVEYPYGFVGDFHRLRDLMSDNTLSHFRDFLYYDRHDITPVESIVGSLYDNIDNPAFGWRDEEFYPTIEKLMEEQFPGLLAYLIENEITSIKLDW